MKKHDMVTLDSCGEVYGFQVVQILEDNRVVVIDENEDEFVYRKSQLKLVHPKEVVNTNIVKLVKVLKDQMIINKKYIQDFKNKLNEDPAFAFRWSGAAMEATAENSVIAKVLRGFDRGNDIEFTVGFFKNIVANGLMNVSQNSNVAVEMFERFELSAHAKVLKRLEGFSVK